MNYLISRQFSDDDNELDDGYTNEPIPNTWIRTCQECGNQQKDNKPTTLTNAYLNRKCKKCKSPCALDYGSMMYIEPKK